MKRLVICIIVICMAFAWVACGNRDAANTGKSMETGEGVDDKETEESKETISEGEAPKLDGLIQEGKLKVGMEIGYPPMEDYDADGRTPIGFDVEVANEVAKRLGLEVEFVDTPWDDIFLSLDNGEYDCIISAVSVTKERQESYLLTKPYVENRLVLVTLKDSEINKPEDLDGKKVAAQIETTADDYVKSLIQDKGIKIKDYAPYEQIPQGYDDLVFGKVDALMCDSVVATYHMDEEADRYDVCWKSEDSEPIAVCLKKGKEGLAKSIDDAIDELFADGTMKKIAEKYFGYDITEGLR